MGEDMLAWVKIHWWNWWRYIADTRYIVIFVSIFVTLHVVLCTFFSLSLCLKQANRFLYHLLVWNCCTGFRLPVLVCRLLETASCTGHRLSVLYSFLKPANDFKFLFVDLKTEQKNKLSFVVCCTLYFVQLTTNILPKKLF